MGLLPSSKKYLPKALEIVNPNGIIHYHGIDDEKPKQLEEDVKNYGKVLKKTKVKSWAPRKYHWILDVKIM